jgi:hypothetical protein
VRHFIGFIAVAIAAESSAQLIPLTVDAQGNCGNDASSLAQLSADGRYTLINSGASNLPLVPAGNSDASLVYDLQTGTRRAVGPHATLYFVDADVQYFYYNVSPQFRRRVIATGTETNIATNASGQAATSSIGHPFVSASGEWLLFDTSSNNMVANDTNNTTDVFLKNTVTGAIRRVSQTFAGAQFTVASTATALSADGTRYVIRTTRDPATGNTFSSNLCVVVDDTVPAVIVTKTCSTATFSTDGRYLLYSNTTGGRRVDLETGVDVIATLNNAGVADNGAGGGTFSADGKWVCWGTSVALPGFGDTNNVDDVYFRDIEGRVTYRASVNNEGFEANRASGRCRISNGGALVGFDTTASNFSCIEPLSSGTSDVFLLDRRRIFAAGFEGG